MLKSIVGATALILSTSVNSAIVDNGTFTTDTESGLDWLDVSATASMSINEVLVSLNPGEQYAEWRYASNVEFEALKTSYFGTLPDYSCYQCALNIDGQVFNNTDWGYYATDDSYGFWATTVEPFANGNFWDELPLVAIGDLDSKSSNIGHFLVKVSTLATVPVPAAAWLFGSGLLGLIGIAKRKKA